MDLITLKIPISTPRSKNNTPWIIIRNLGHPSGTDTIGTVHQYHGQDGDVPLGFNPLVVVQLVGQHCVVSLVENVPVKMINISCNLQGFNFTLSKLSLLTSKISGTMFM